MPGKTGPQSNGTYALDNDALFGILEMVRRSRGMSLRAVAKDIGIAEHAFTRLKRGESVSSNTLIGILVWIGFEDGMVPINAISKITEDQS